MSYNKIDKIVGNVASITGDTAGMINALATPITQLDNSSQMQDIYNTNTQFVGGNDDLMSQFSTAGLAKNNYNITDLGWNGRNVARNIISGGIAGAQLGSTIGGMFGNSNAQSSAYQAGGAAAGTLFGGILASALIPAYKSKLNRQVNELNIAANAQNSQAINNFSNAARTSSNKMFNNSMLNLAAFGGNLDMAIDYKKYTIGGKIKPMKNNYIGNKFAYGGEMKFSGDFSNGVTIVNEGGTHEENIYDGVQVGVDPQGVPNLVEEGEVIFNDYVFSNRLKPTEKQLDDVHLDKKYANKSFSDIAKSLQEYSAERPNDPIAKNGLIDSMTKLQVAQEDIRQKKELSKIKREFNKLSDEEKTEIMSSMQPQEQGDEFAYGGKKGNMFEGLGPDKNSIDFIGPMPRNTKALNLERFSQALNSRDSLLINNAANRQLEDAVQSILFSDNINRNSGVGFWNSPSGIVDDIGVKYQYHPYLNISGPKIYEDLRIDGEIPSGVLGQNNLVTNTPQTATTKPSAQRQKESQKTTQNKNYKPVEIPDVSMADEELDNIIKGINDYDKNELDKIAKEASETKLNFYNPSPIVNKMVYNQPLRTRQTASRYAPIFENALGTIVESFTPVDYSDADIIRNAANNLPRYGYNPVGGYIEYNPVDQNYLLNRIANENLAAQRQAMNSGLNRGQAMANLMAINNSNTGNIGDTYLKMYQANNANKADAAKFNAQLNEFNSQLAQRANDMNSNIDARRASMYQYMAQLRDQLSTLKSNAISNNLTSLANSIGNVGQDNFFANQADWYGKYVAPNNAATKSYKNANGGKLKKNK